MNNVVEFIQAFAPWITGGLAGALFTFVANRILLYRSQTRLSISRNTQEFSLPDRTQLQKLKVSYAGTEYESLSLCQLTFANTGRNLLEDAVFIIELDREATLIESFTVSQPVQIEATIDQNNLQKNHFRLSMPRLHSGDTFEVGFLVDGQPQIKQFYRGKQSVKTVERSGQFTANVESDVRYVLILLLLLFAVSNVPEIGGILQFFLMIISMPRLIGIISRMVESWTPASQVLSIDMRHGSVEGSLLVDQKAK